MITDTGIVVGTFGVIFLIAACMFASKKNAGWTIITLAVGLFLTVMMAYTGGLGTYTYGIKSAQAGQVYYSEIDPITSVNGDGDILVLLLPIPIESLVGNVSAYNADVLKQDPIYYKISKAEIEPGLKKGDILIKINGKIQKFKPVGS